MYKPGNVFIGEAIEKNGEFQFICPNCGEDISCTIDDFGPIYDCPVCAASVQFPEPKEAKTID
jgi:predicted RNA-binding Zn-ribbon protein involved in translation (DUF1610 family)